MKLYTKGGDQGSTSLIGGERVSKCDSRVEAYGTIDELSAQIAMLRDMLAKNGIKEFSGDLVAILRTLMAIEALMAVGRGAEGKVKDIPEADIKTLETRIDEISSTLPPLKNFTVPGGDMVISQAHICRTVCRRAERRACRAAAEHDISSNAMIYLNRLSDYLYAVGRRTAIILNIQETLWEP